MSLIPLAGEAQRLKSLRIYKALGAFTDQTLNRLTQLAAQLCEVPISLISIVDHTHQWFSASIDIDIDSTPREISFCTHTIMDDQLLVVEDATQDARFSQNPLVLGAPHIRF
jgi:GAF domain-containing protein